ncbi:MAG: protein kinase [Planctomycetes bacterium]|nr:protein kinase [Planctomycetota bacterium]
MRCPKCRSTETWQVSFLGMTPYARRIQASGRRLESGAWMSPATGDCPATLARVLPGFYCVGCAEGRPELRGEEVYDALAREVPPQPGAVSTGNRGAGEGGGAGAKGKASGASRIVPSATAGVPGPAFDLDSAIAILRAGTKDQHQEPIKISDPAPARTVSADAIAGLEPAVRALLVRDPYEHQADAVRKGLEGRSIVLSTATASGKSLVYQTLAAQALLDPQATVLYLAPLNALLTDQLDAFERFFGGGTPAPVRAEGSLAEFAREVYIGETRLHVARYDGAVPSEGDRRREIVRLRPRLLLTNPEMLVRAILTRAHGNKGPEIKPMGAPDVWSYLFKGLRLVVIDELHAYRGVFGAHLANILRRVRRMTHLCGGDDGAIRYVACSATIREPARTAGEILGTDDLFVVGPDRDTSPRHRRVMIAVTSRGERLETFAGRLLPKVAFEAGARTIAFRDNIPAIQALAKRLSRDHGTSRVRVFCRNYPADEKAKRLRDLRDGSVQCLISTSALELGIDIGDLNASVLLGYPGSIAKTWQMLGRAGRAGDGLLLFVADTNYLDQYWYEHANELVPEKSEPEEIIVDPDNEYVVEEHVRGAALDHVLDPERDGRFFGDTPEGGPFARALNALGNGTNEGLRQEQDVWILPKTAEKRAREIPLRSLGQFSVPVYEGARSDEKWPLLEEQSHRAPQRLFRGAVFVWEGKYYRSLRLVIPEDGSPAGGRDVYAEVEELERPGHLTIAKTRTETTILSRLSKPLATGGKDTGWGRVEVRTIVEGYYKDPRQVCEIEGSAGEVGRAGYVAFDDDGPPQRAYRTQGAWFQLGPEITGTVEDARLGLVLETVAEALVRAAPLLRFASPGDLDASAALNAADFADPDPVIYVNETVLGGAGLARRLFERRRDAVGAARKLLADCPRCSPKRARSNGCPLCVSVPSGLQDRAGAITLLDAWEKALAGTPAALPPAPPGGGPRVSIPELMRRLGFGSVTHVANGGMGSVWRGLWKGRDVAIKLARDDGGDSTRAARRRDLKAEAERLLSLDHSNILKVLHVQPIEGGVAVVTDWADGGDLGAFRRREPPPTEEVAFEVWRKIVAAVAYLHTSGVVHRDLKDTNILFRKGEPLVADFGVARDLRRERRTTAQAGTSDWAAPEQLTLAGGVAPIAATMDVFALGRLLAYLLTGDATAAKVNQVRGFPAAIPERLHAVLARCLAKDPCKRPVDAIALSKELPS